MSTKLHYGGGAGTRVRRRLFAMITAVTLVAPLLIAGAMPVVAVDAGILANSTITAEAETATAGDSVTITVQLNDGVDNLIVSGGTVTLTSDQVGALTVVDNDDGTYTAELIDTVARLDTVTGTLAGEAFADSATVDFAPGPASPERTTITAAAGPFTVDSPSAGLTVQLKDQYDNNLAGSDGTVDLSPSAGNATISNLADAGDGTWTATVDLTDNIPTQLTVGGTLGDFAITTGDASVDFLPGDLAEFTIDPIADQTAGDEFQATISAFDQYDNPKTDYDGGTLSGLGTSPGCTACDPDLDATAPYYGTLSWSDGVATASITAYDADAAAALTITDDPVSATSDTFAVAHAAALKGFSFASIGSQTAGGSFGVTVTARDLYGNVKADQSAGTLSALENSPGCAGCLPVAIPVATPTYGDPVSWTSGTGTATVNGFKARTDASLTITDGLISNTTSFVEGPAALGGFTIDNITSHVAGAEITVTVRAYDLYGNAKTDYSSLNLLAGDLAASPGCAGCNPVIVASSPDYGTISWTDGVGTATVHAYAVGASSVSFSAGGFSATSNSFSVTLAALGGFTVASIADQTASSTGFTVTANAYDLYGNPKTNYTTGASVTGTLGTSPVCSTCSDGGTAPEYGSLTWLSGVGTTTVKAYKAETGQTITVSDTGASRTSNSFAVGSAGVSVLDFATADTGTAFNGQPTSTKKGTPIYHTCALPGSGADPCNTSSPPVQVLARDQYGNVVSGVVVGLTGTQALSGSPSATTNASGLASFTGPAPIVADAATTGTVYLTASATGASDGTSATFQLVDDLEACANATCDNLATGGLTSYSRIDATGGVSGFVPAAGGALDGVSLVTQFQSVSANCTGTTTQVGRTTDVHVEALGGVPQLNFKVALIIPKGLLQSTGYASRNVGAFNICFGATYLSADPPTTLWRAKTSPTDTTLVDAVPSGGLYWGWLPDCSGKKAPALTDPANPCVVIRTKTAKGLQAALGLSNAQFATLGFGAGDLAIVYQTRTPWDAKASIF
ncbi:MAG TPA: invasin domain 3-containing protein [Candidatus Eisenbacteria bacterium]|nr:invasin domain 3-containing protein [Candidatus Eisenbacteria bacterium]